MGSQEYERASNGRIAVGSFAGATVADSGIDVTGP